MWADWPRELMSPNHLGTGSLLCLADLYNVEPTMLGEIYSALATLQLPNMTVFRKICHSQAPGAAPWLHGGRTDGLWLGILDLANMILE